ncbi:hypothetical protein [Schlesneria paludicola]|uniref:hypothetical protein n=1 Tax=Schlesneria paludicola TaxID=360056 RepID=UPI00031346FD|nr:hypothetical protein [Schlesneria paludicola]
MPPRLLIGNFDFEHQLAEPTKRDPSAKLKSFYAQLATAWLSVAEDGDWIWTPLPIDPEFWNDATRAGLPAAQPVVAFADVPRDVQCVPWGWSEDTRRLVTRFGWHAEIPSAMAVRRANSRATSEELERRWNVALPHARRAESLEELNNAIRTLAVENDRWVVKAEFGMSARERILGRGPLKPAEENWVRRKLSINQAVFFEPWVNRLEEIGIQIDVPQHGEPRLIGLTPMQVDERGQYAGSWFAWNESRFRCHRTDWSTSIEVALRAALDLQSHGYFGPLGIDAMAYTDLNGTVRFRPLQDLNARWTMGRFSLGWNRLLKSGEEGEWKLIRRDEDHPRPSDHHVCRSILTSPRQVDGVDCEHLARIEVHAHND